MGKLLIVVGVLIIAYGLSPFGPLMFTPEEGSIDLSSHIGFGANSSLVIPKPEINNTIAYVQAIEDNQVFKAKQQQRRSDYLLTLVVVLSGLVSMAAGYQRILSKLKKPDVIVVASIAVLSAGVAISTFVAGRIENLSKTRLDCIDKVRPMVSKKIADVEGTQSEIQARRYLKELRSAADRCDT